MRHILTKVIGTVGDRRLSHRTRIEVTDEFERDFRYDSIDDLPEPIRGKVELGPIPKSKVMYVYLEEDTEPVWNRCPECLWPNLLHGVLVEEAICQEGDDPTSYYHDPVDWVTLKYLKCSSPCGWQHDYDADATQSSMNDVPKMMFRLHLLAEKERANAT